MFCIEPIDCWKCGTCVCDDGVVSPRLIFSFAKALEYFSRSAPSVYHAIQAADNAHISLVCGKCPACLMRKRKDMSVRISNEVACHDDCCFITLTYNNESVPVAHPNHETHILELTRGIKTRSDDGLYTLVPADVQKFIKRLRRHLEYIPIKRREYRDHVGKPIRYFCVGEYGSKSHRPHYHLIIFGWKPSDQYIHDLRDGYTINRSPQLEKLWKFGFSTCANVNHGVAKYCARYVTKKYVTSVADELYPYVVPEFTLQSTRNGGIGSLWLEKYSANLRHGFINIRNGERISKCSIPRYYYDRLRKINLPLWLELREERVNYLNVNRKPTDFGDVFNKVEIEYDKFLYSLTKEEL